MPLEHFARTFVANGSFGEGDGGLVTDELGVDGHAGQARENAKVGSLGFHALLQPGETWTVPLAIGWYFPIFDTALPEELGRTWKM